MLTNKDLIHVADLGMGDAIILSQIENAQNDFDANTNALMDLKKAGLSDAVLSKVIQAANNTAKKVVDPMTLLLHTGRVSTTSTIQRISWKCCPR